MTANPGIQVPEAKIKHLEMIQAIISRMATNSFLVKGWAITVVAALFALGQKDSNPWLVIVCVAPTLLFWYLDALYLRQEKLFRELYKAVSKDLRLHSNEVDLFSMDTTKYKGRVKKTGVLMFSSTLGVFFGSLCLALIAGTLILLNTPVFKIVTGLFVNANLKVDHFHRSCSPES